MRTTKKHAQVLIVDDDPALLEALSETLQLRMERVSLQTCDSASTALEHLSRTDYDAIVADIKSRQFGFDPTVQGALGQVQPRRGFAGLAVISDPPTSAQISTARAFLRGL